MDQGKKIKRQRLESKNNGTITANSSSSCASFDGLSNPETYDDAFLAKEMNALSLQEREQIEDDIHGVGKHPEDLPGFDLQKKIDELDIALSSKTTTTTTTTATKSSHHQRRKAYDRACFLRPSLVTDTNFKRMFLRADEYDVPKAAERIIQHFHLKYELFGDEKVAKDISFNDISESSSDIIIDGEGQGQGLNCFIDNTAVHSVYLPTKDARGRPIVFTNMGCIASWWNLLYQTIVVENKEPGKTILRSCWYFLMCLTSDDDYAQKFGVCRLLYIPASYRLYGCWPFLQNSKLLQRINELVMSSIPIRLTSYHFCFEDTSMNAIISLYRMIVGKELRLRMRIHCGSPLEMQYSLRTFGIHCDGLLLDKHSWNRDLPKLVQKQQQIMNKYFENRKVLEERKKQTEHAAEMESGIILYPSEKDVLIGLGAPTRDYVGTRVCVGLVESRLEQYINHGDDQFLKSFMSMDVVIAIKATGGRFLSQCKDRQGWKVMEDIKARDKVSGLFRYKARMTKKKEQKLRAEEAAADGRKRKPSSHFW